MIEQTLKENGILLKLMNNLKIDFVRMKIELKKNGLNHYYRDLVTHLRDFYQKHSRNQNITLRDLHQYLKDHGVRREIRGPFIFELYEKTIIF